MTIFLPDRFDWVTNITMAGAMPFAQLAVAIRSDVTWSDRPAGQLISVEEIGGGEKRRSIIAFLPYTSADGVGCQISVHGPAPQTNPVAAWLIEQLMMAGWSVEPFQPGKRIDDGAAPAGAFSNAKKIEG